MATVNMLTYMKNVGRSLGYSAIDTLKAYNPTVVAAADTAKTYTTDLYHAVKDFNASLKEKKDSNEASLIGDVKDTLKDTWNNTKADLLSGNLYNKQRIKAGEEEMMKSMFGDLDFNFDDDFGDFDFDDDLEDTGEDKIVSAEMESAKAIVTGADMIGAKMSGSINSTTVAVGDHIAKSQERSSKAIYSLTERGFGQVSVGIAAVNSNLTILSALAEPLNLHMQNSATFYAKSTEFQNKMLEMMEKVVKNTDDGSNNRSRYSSSSTANRITDLITADGVIDLKAYSEMVMKNIRNYTDIAKDMIEMMGGVKNAGKMVSSSPISIMLNFGMKKMMPQLMKDTMENFNKMLADMMPVALDKFRTMQFDNPILGVLKDLMVPETGVKITYMPGKYPRGKMPWDGESKRALTYVIPMHLARIETLLSGKPSKMYNYTTGRFIYPAIVKKEHNDLLRRTAKYASDASYEIDSILRQQASKGKISEKDRDRMSTEFENFLIEAMKSGDTAYLDFMKDSNTPPKGMRADTYRFIKEVIKYKESKGDYKFRNNMNAGIVRSRDEITSRFRNMENGDDDSMKILFDNSIDFDENGNQRTPNSILTSVTDQYNNNLFFYLQGIYLHTKHVSDNLGLLVVRGGRVKGQKLNRNAQIRPIDTITVVNNNSNSNSASNTNIADANIQGPMPANQVLDHLTDAIDTAAGEISTLPPELREYERLKKEYKGDDWEHDSKYDAEKEKQLNAALKAGKAKKAIKGWLADTAVGRSINKFFETLGKPADIISKRVTGLFDAVTVSLNNKIYGEDNAGGILDYLREIRDDFRNIFRKFANKLGFKLFGNRDENGNFDSNKFFGRMFNESKETLKNVGSYIKNKFTFARGGRVTKTGLATLHEGEYVIPTGRGTEEDEDDELKAAIKGQMAEGQSFFFAKHFAKKKLEAKREYQEKWREENEKLQQEIDDLKEKIKNSPLGKLVDFTKTGAETLGKGILKTAQEIFGDPEKDKEKINDFMGDLKSKFVKIFGEEGEGGLGGMGAGAIVGGGLSILTGSMINPILGAGIGAAVGLIKKSETVQELLFGNENNRNDLQKAMAKFFTDNLPDTALGAGVGGLAGTLFMGSPLLGTILGAGLGFAASSDKVKNYLFGEGDLDNGLIRKDTQEKIKKALPNIGAGAIAGLIAGPFGIAGNLILGSTLGYITSTEKFKEWFFGVEDENGNRVGGVTQVLRENIKEVRKDIVKPLLGIFDKLAEEFRQGFRDMVYNIRNVISKAASGLITHLKTHGIFRDIMNSVPMQGMMNLGKSIIRKPGQIVSGALKGMNNRLSKRALLRGYRVKDEEGNVLDAAGRMALAENLPKFSKGEDAESDWGKIDVNIGNMSLEQITATQGAIEDIKKNRDEAALRNRQTAERIRLHDEILHYIKLPKGDARAILGNIDKMIEGGIESGDFTQLMNWLDSTELIDDNAKIRVATAIAKTETATAQLRERIAQFKLLKEKMGKGFNIDRYSERLATEATSREAEKASMDEAEEKSKREKIFESITKNIPDSINDMVYLLSFIADPNKAAIETARLEEIRKKREGTFKNFNAVGGRKNIADSSASSAAELLDDLYHENDEVTKEGTTKEDGGKTIIYHNGEWIDKEEYEKDKELKDALIGNLPFLSGIKGVFGKIGDLLGIGENKKGPLQKLFEKLFGDDTDDNPGLLGGLFNLFTGGKYPGASGVGAVLKNLWSSIGGLATTVGIGGLIFAGFSGVLDRIANAIPGMGGGDNDSNGNTYQETATTSDGTQVTKINGVWTDAEGNEYSDSDINISSVNSRRVDTASFSERLWGDAIRGTLTGGPSVLKTGLKALGSTNTIQTIEKVILTDEFWRRCDILRKKLVPILMKFGIPERSANLAFISFKNQVAEKGFLKAVSSGAIGKSVAKGKLIGKYGLKGLAKGAAKETVEDVTKTFFGPVEIAFIVIDFMSGYEDARTTLGIIDDPNVGQRILSGLLRAIKNVIPLVGPMIPDSFVVDVFAQWIAPALGMDVSELTEARGRAQEALDAYNEATGSNITDVGEFNKKVLKDYSITERFGNIVVNEFNKTKTVGGQFVEGVKEKGITAIPEILANNLISGFMTGFNGEGNYMAKLFAGISGAVKSIPILGSLAGRFTDLMVHATKGDLAGLWTDSYDEFEGGNENIEGTDLTTAVPGIFTKLISILDNFQVKLLLTPVTLAIMAGNALTPKVQEMISPIVDAVKSHTNLDTLKNMWDATLKGDVAALTKAGDTFNGPNEGFMGTTMTVVNAIPKVLLVPLTMQIGNARAIADKLKSVIDKGKAVLADFVQVHAPIAKAAFSGDIFGVLQGGREPVDPEDPFTPMQNIASITTRGLYMPIAIMSFAGKSAYERISKIIDFGKLVFGQLGQVAKYSVDATLAGDVDALLTPPTTGEDENGDEVIFSRYQRIVGAGLNFLLTPIAVGVRSGKTLWNDYLQPTMEATKASITIIKDFMSSKFEFAKTGDLDGLWTPMQVEEGTPIDGFAHAANIGANVLLTLPTLVVSMGSKLSEIFNKKKDAFSENYALYDQFTSSLADIAVKGSITDIWEAYDSSSYNEEDPIHGLWYVFGFFSKITLVLTKLFESVIDKAGPIIDFVGDKLNTARETLDNAGDTAETVWDYTKQTAANALDSWRPDWTRKSYWFDQGTKEEGEGSRLAGKGFVSQTDPRYAGMRMGNGESVAEAGCAPAVASMVSQYYGKPMSMQQAINRSSAFQTPDGTTIDYFGNALSGGSTINTAPIGDTNGVMNNLASGNPVIMLGQDGRNTSKSNSPFGPGSHYVLGTGLDRSGNIIVNDPEQNGPRSYSPAILGSLRSAIGTSGGSSRMKNMKITPIKVRLSAGRGSVQSRKPEIWSWLHAKAGFNDVQAAAIMGCWEAESGNSPKRIECDYLYNYDIDWDGVATDEGLDYYCVNKVFPKYKPGKINKEGYKHNGHYYPGLGLAGWTGGRCRDLVMFAKSKGRAWYDLETQLDFFMGEMTNKYSGLYNSLKACNNLADATELFATKFEHGAFKKGTSHYNDRYRNAQTIYAQFTGQPFVDINGYDSASGGSMKVSAIDKLLQIAMAEEGYTEHNSEAHVQEMGGNGHDNWNKYGYLTGAPHDMWCASYVSWVYDKLVDGDKNKFAALLGGGPSASCATLRNNAMNAGLYTDKPSVGDVVIFGTKGSRPASHTGIVIGVNPDGTYDLINGNASDAVRVAKNRSTNKNVANGNQYPDGFIHPRWSEVFPGMVDSYSNPYGNSFTSAMASAGASMASSSGNVLSDITGVFSTVLSNIFNAGRNQSSDASSTYSDYSGYNSYSDYSSYYSDYSTLDDYSKDYSGDSSNKYSAGDYHNAYETKVLEGQNNARWTWANANQKGPKDTAQQHQWDAAKTAYEKALLLAKWNNRTLKGVAGIPSNAQSTMSDQQIIDYYMNNSKAGSGSGLVRGRGSRRSNPYIANYATPSGRGSSTRYTYAGRGPESTPAGNTTIINPGNIDKTTAMLLKTIITCIETVASNTSSINGIYEVLTEMAKRGGSTEAALAAIEAANANKNTQVDGALESLKATVDAILAS